ncbi:MAG: hypothetical protein HGA47_05980 [Zoogloea sp.]|nr:hypothetical protein [Zoogloea sp.]
MFINPCLVTEELFNSTPPAPLCPEPEQLDGRLDDALNPPDGERADHA